MSTRLVETHIVDTHLHYHPGNPAYDPEILFEHDVISTAWILSSNGLVKGSATDQEILDLARRYRDRIVPFAFLDLDGDPGQVKRFREQGFAGLKVLFPRRPYDDGSYFPMWEEVQAVGMPVVIHVGGSYNYAPELTAGPEHTFSRNMLPLTVDVPLKLFPQITFILAHFGGDKHCLDLGVYLARGHSRVRGHAPVFLDLSGGHLLSWDALKRIKEAIEDVGPDAVIYGNDLTYPQAVRCALFWDLLLRASWFRHSDWPDRIMGGNADRIIEESSWSYDRIA